MSVVDVHPEDLIDREARGSLSFEERAHLDAHLSRCSACRLERQVRADFAAELAPRREGPGMHELVYGALLVAQDEKQAPELRVRAPRRFRAVALLVAIPALLMSGLAFAQTELGGRLGGQMVELARVTLGMSAAAAPAQPRPLHARRRPSLSSASAPAPALLQAPALAPARAPAPAPALTPARHHSRHHHRSSRLAPAPVLPPQPSEAAAPAPLLQEAALTPQSLFERANSARRAGRMLEASALYRELGTRFGSSSEARIAVVLLARLQLDSGESDAALAGFEAYLASGHGALREQAMAGRAQALRRLGQSADERAAVRELLRAYPDSAYGKLARERLELSEP